MNELVDRVGLSQPGVSKHLKVLREAGLVAVRPDGKRASTGCVPRRSPRSPTGWSRTASTGTRGSTHSNTTWRRTRDDRHAGDHGRPPRAALRAPPSPPASSASGARSPSRRSSPAGSSSPGPVDPRGGRGVRGRRRHRPHHRLDPPRNLAWEWGAERYRFELTADGDDATTLVFTHVFNRELGPDWQHAAGWETYFAGSTPTWRAATSPRRRRTRASTR